MVLSTAQSQSMGSPSPPSSGQFDTDGNNQGNEKLTARRGISWIRRPSAKTPSAQLALAKDHEARGNLIRAGRAYLALVYAWPDSNEAPQAGWALAHVFELRKKYSDAFEEYQYLIDRYVGQFPYDQALERQFAIAALRKDRDLFEKVVRNGPHWVRAAEAQFQAAYIDETRKDFDSAIIGYQAVQNRFSNRQFTEEAAFREAHCLLKLARRQAPQDEVRYITARTAMARFLRIYPRSHFGEEARRAMRDMEFILASLAYDRATFYDHRMHPPRLSAALLAYKDFVKRYASDDRVEVARIRIAELEKITESNDHEINKVQ